MLLYQILFLLLHFLLCPSHGLPLHDQQVFTYQTRLPALEDASIHSILLGLSRHEYTSLELTQAYLQRMSVFDDIRAIIQINPRAEEDAVVADRQREELVVNGSGALVLPSHLPLLGVPFLVKDNIAVPPSVGPTSAGSYALVNTTVISGSKVVQRLLNAGAVLLGTTNLDEFAQAKGDHPWGFSALGGQMHSIYGSGSSDIAVREGYSDVCGSSGGSALSVALGLASFSLGTQTGVSIVCPAGRAGVVGFKPGRGGMMPMEGVIPISKHLDVVGPIARTVSDVELVWRVIKHPKNWTDAFSSPPFVRSPNSQIRIGVPRNVFHTDLDDVLPVVNSFNSFLAFLSTDSRFHLIDKEVVNVTAMVSDTLFSNISTVTSHDLKLGLEHYLSEWTIPSPYSPKNLKDIVNYNLDHPSLELPPGPFPVFNHQPRDDEHYNDQSFLVKSQSIEVPGWKNETYRIARETLERVGWTEGLEPYFHGKDGVDFMLIPTEGVSGGIASLAAVPQITLPLSYYPSNQDVPSNATWPLYPYPSMPFGVSLLGSRGHDSHELLLETAKVLEEILGAAAKERGEGLRRDMMRNSVRKRLVELSGGH